MRSFRKPAIGILLGIMAGQAEPAAGQVPLEPQETLYARAVASVSTVPQDTYRVTLRVTREGTSKRRREYLPNGHFNASTSEWRHGPTTFSIKLTGERPGDPVHSIMIDLALWPATLARWSAETGTGSAFRNPEAIERARESTRDAEILLRVLQGIVHYGGEYNFEQPLLEFEGGYERTTAASTSYPEPRVESHREDAWSSTEPASDRGPRSAYSAGAIDLTVWRFRAEDMRRIDELARDLEQVRSSLTLHPRDGDPDAVRRVERFHGFFRDPLIKAILVVSELAWDWGPFERPPSPATRTGGADPALPPLPSETIMVLRIPQLGIFPDEEPGGRRITSYRSWDIPRERFDYDVGAPGRERHSAAPCVWNDLFWCSTVRAAPSTAVFEGHFTASVESVESERWRNEGVEGEYQTDTEFRETHRIEWLVQREGTFVQPDPDDVLLRVVKLVRGSYRPYEGPLSFGVPFFVEAELEEGDSRDAMAVTVGDGASERVVELTATEDDPRVLRSKMLYLIWDDRKDADEVRP